MATQVQQVYSFAADAVAITITYDDATNLASALSCVNATEQPVPYSVWDGDGHFYQGTFQPGIDSRTFDVAIEMDTVGFRAGWSA